MKTIDWKSDSEFSVDGVNFVCTISDYSLKTSEDRVVILKSREVLSNYWRMFADHPPKTIFEFGIFQGGSPALFSLVFDVDKYVAVDLSPPVDAFEALLRKHPVGRRIKNHYGVSQTDRAKVEAIIQQEFGGQPLDLVIDDASHLYQPTKQAFEIAFPLLRPGGTYVIEDWGWAHWYGSPFFVGQTAMSLLVMELVMLCASRPDIVSEVTVFPAFVFIKKSEHASGLANMSVSSLYQSRGIELRGVESPPPSAETDVARAAGGERTGLGLPRNALTEVARDALRRLRSAVLRRR